jgi:hypothetical protein
MTATAQTMLHTCLNVNDPTGQTWKGTEAHFSSEETEPKRSYHRWNEWPGCRNAGLPRNRGGGDALV